MRDFLSVPFLTPQAARAAAVAVRTAVPVWLVGEPGAGTYWVARALHRGGDPRGFVSVRVRLDDAAELDRRLREQDQGEAGALCLYVERLETQPTPVQEAVLRAIDEGVRLRGRPIPVRVVAQSDRPEASRDPAILESLRHRLSVLVIPLPGLGERRGELAEIAAFFLSRAARRSGRAAPSLEPGALERLAREATTIEELEAILWRATLRDTGGRIGPADLDAEPVEPREAPLPPPSPPSGASLRLEALAMDLAHELKNPMVTIRTFAQHLDQLAADSELRTRLAALTCEAIERMDGVLEELVQFARFKDPAPRSFALGESVRQAIAALAPELQGRIQWNGLAPDPKLRADPEQIAFALRMLLRGLARELPADTPIVVSSTAVGRMVVRAEAPGSRGKVEGLLGSEETAPEASSLPLAFAESLVSRNGGSCRVLRAADSIEATVVLPLADGG